MNHTRHIDTEVQLSIGRGSDDVVRITIEDRRSGVLVADLELSLADFAKAVTNLTVTVPATIYSTDRHGKDQRIGFVLVPGLDYETWRKLDKLDGDGPIIARRVMARDALRASPPFAGVDADEWDIDEYELRQINGHRIFPGGYQVTVRRYVDRPDPT